jgi:hypothetical protein
MRSSLREDEGTRTALVNYRHQDSVRVRLVVEPLLLGINDSSRSYRAR